MTMTIEGEARIRRVGNGLCIPLPVRAVRDEGLKEGSLVHYVVLPAGGLNPAAFGSAHHILKGIDLQAEMDLFREEEREP